MIYRCKGIHNSLNREIFAYIFFKPTNHNRAGTLTFRYAYCGRGQCVFLGMIVVLLCENEGFGMDELLSWQKITNAKVEIESEREFSRVILYLPENGANLGANEAQAVENGSNLGANKQRILHAIQIDNTLSVLKLQVLTNIPLRTLQREINELIELGALQKGGTRKNIIWTIKNI